MPLVQSDRVKAKTKAKNSPPWHFRIDTLGSAAGASTAIILIQKIVPFFKKTIRVMQSFIEMIGSSVNGLAPSKRLSTARALEQSYR